MDRCYARRKQAVLADCKVPQRLLRGALQRLVGFVAPFAERLTDPTQREHAVAYCQGLVSDVERKNVEAIAYQHDQDRRNLQHFIGTSAWDHASLMDELCDQVADELGEPDAVLVIDPSAFPKCGKQSVGVQRQWCGRLGKVENCQVGVYLGYASRSEHALVDFRLYLPKEWACDRPRRKAAGVPKKLTFQTRHELALEMLRERRATLRHRWVTADDEFGKVGHFRRQLHELQETYLLAVPGSTNVRVLAGEELPRRGQKGPKAPPFQRVDQVAALLPAGAWQRVDVRDGEKGALIYEVAVVPRVQAKGEGRAMKYVETLVVIRYTDSSGTRQQDYYLSDAAPSTLAAEFARVACAERRVEECIRRSKGEAGLADYEVRHWLGWHHHQTLSLIATWFLVQETRRGKKAGPGIDRSTGTEDPCAAPAFRLEGRTAQLDSAAFRTTIAA
jgi:SRSO17 transposase